MLKKFLIILQTTLKLIEKLFKSKKELFIFAVGLNAFTLEELKKLKEKLEKEGYAFVTIDELAKLKNIELKKEKSYYQINN